MIAHSVSDGRLVFKVQVVPRSSRSEVAGEHNGSLRVRVTAPPVEGAANKELTQVLAKAFKVSRSAVSILSGQNSRLKQVSIEGVNSSALAELLGGIKS
ncbi:MAG TPA: DUF167 domain-containing protein [Pyrinomonadaceae bacterium]|nr:DUF167 domain-containing protein [Pyrinomonadaceae bacterium]